jgi:hypothetical protein
MNFRRFSILIIIFLSASINSFSQLIRGIVLDKNSKPVPYVNIGILDKNTGTISNENGSFEIDMKGAEKSSIIRVSCIGYETKDFQVSSVSGDYMKIILDEKTFPIGEVVISSKKSKLIKFGSMNVHNGVTWGITEEGLESANLYSNHKEIFLKTIKFNIKGSEFDSVLFRLNFYIRKDTVPVDQINHSQIFIMTRNPGWAEKDLTSYNLFIESDFIASLELVKGWKNSNQTKKYVGLSKRVTGHSLRRGESQGKWLLQTGQFDFYLTAKEK